MTNNKTEKKQILITGATGNVGYEVIRYLSESQTSCGITAGVRNTDKARDALKAFPQLNLVEFDFEKVSTFDHALENIDCIFLLRPPHLADTDKYFRPFIEMVVKKKITQVVFLSVQGAEKSPVIPHHKIEKLIRNSGTDYIFLRPGYFMQNLITTLQKDIREKNRIILPAGKAKFNWIDVRNIGEVAAIVLTNFELFQNRAIELTGSENMDFAEVTHLINNTLNCGIQYINAHPFRFYRVKKREGLHSGFILVMILLHFLPRFQAEPVISDFYKQLTGKHPTILKEFLIREAGQLVHR